MAAAIEMVVIIVASAVTKGVAALIAPTRDRTLSRRGTRPAHGL